MIWGDKKMEKRNKIWEEIERMQKEMDQLMKAFSTASFWDPVYDFSRGALAKKPYYPGKSLVPQNYRNPLVDMVETDKNIQVVVELPGIDKKDIDVVAVQGGLQIKVEKKSEKKQENKKKGLFHMERSYTGFYRFVSLPENAELDKISAGYKNGILELTIPKKTEPKTKRKSVPIN
jgi:HSP20 family protein